MTKRKLKKVQEDTLDFIDKKAKEFVVHPFKVGDVVCLKSGGRPMTIASLGNWQPAKKIEDLSPVLCWFDTDCGPKKEWIDVGILREY